MNADRRPRFSGLTTEQQAPIKAANDSQKHKKQRLPLLIFARWRCGSGLFWVAERKVDDRPDQIVYRIIRSSRVAG